MSSEAAARVAAAERASADLAKRHAAAGRARFMHAARLIQKLFHWYKLRQGFGRAKRRARTRGAPLGPPAPTYRPAPVALALASSDAAALGAMRAAQLAADAAGAHGGAPRPPSVAALAPPVVAGPGGAAAAVPGAGGGVSAAQRARDLARFDGAVANPRAARARASGKRLFMRRVLRGLCEAAIAGRADRARERSAVRIQRFARRRAARNAMAARLAAARGRHAAAATIQVCASE
jgi:hypothetical protein